MKRVIFLVLLITCLAVTANAQKKILGMGGNIGGNVFFGDSRIFDSKIGINSGIYGLLHFSPKFDLKLQVGFGKFGVFRTDQISKALNTSFVPVELNLHYLLLPKSSVNPFLHVGLGAMGFKTNGSPIFYDGLFIGGGGMSVPVNSKWSFMVTTDIRYTTGDDFNGVNKGLKDAYISFQSGMTYYFNDSPQEFRRKELLEKNRIIAQKEEDRRLELVQINTTISNLHTEFKKREAEIEELKENVKIRLSRIQNLEVQIAEFRKNRDQQELHKPLAIYTIEQVTQLYKNALQQFNARNYQAAINELTDLTIKFSEHPLISNFHYWIGESYFGMNNYSEAIKAFSRVEEIPSSHKLDDALIMAGVSYIKVGDFENAKVKLEKLIRQNPYSEYIQRANKNLRTIQAKVIS